MLCEVIGFSTEDDIDTHAEWCKHVFPPDMWDVPLDLKELEHKYLFVLPHGPNGQVRTTIRQKVLSTRHMQAQLHKSRMFYERIIEELVSFQDQSLFHAIKSALQLIMSNTQTTLEIYDTLNKERITPYENMARLMHVAQVKSTYSTLNSVMTHGGLSDAGKFAATFNQTMQSVLKTMDLAVVNASMQRAVSAKTNQLQNDLFDAKQENLVRAMEVAKQLAGTVKQQESVQPTQPVSTQKEGKNVIKV